MFKLIPVKAERPKDVKKKSILSNRPSIDYRSYGMLMNQEMRRNSLRDSFDHNFLEK